MTVAFHEVVYRHSHSMVGYDIKRSKSCTGMDYYTVSKGCTMCFSFSHRGYSYSNARYLLILPVLSGIGGHDGSF